ncbi:carboxypeptidase-like regulatory domain-containing protein [Chryseolinea sp. T2]
MNLLVKGTTTGTVSDGEGKFRLKAEETSEVGLTFIGYETATLQKGK